MIGAILAVLLAALVYWLCVAIGLPWIVAVIAAVIVLVAAFSGYGRYGSRSGPPL